MTPLITRTPYSVAPYDVDNYRSSLGPSLSFEQEGFIFVYQDARGRYMSEGEFLTHSCPRWLLCSSEKRSFYIYEYIYEN